MNISYVQLIKYCLRTGSNLVPFGAYNFFSNHALVLNTQYKQHCILKMLSIPLIFEMFFFRF